MKTTVQKNLSLKNLNLRGLTWTATYGAVASLLLAGCGSQLGLQDSTAESLVSSSGLQSSKFDLNLHPMNKTVCDPFSGGVPKNPTRGLQASLFYSAAGTPRLYSSQDYIEKATASTQTLFFSDLNVPTRMFTEGFSTQSSNIVKDDSGNKLIEFFGLKFETVLHLSEQQPEGNYELATLADDGIVVKAKINDQWRTLINNDGDHPTQMGCAIATLNLTRTSAIPLEITYYQGPRTHIANVLMWRKSATSGTDSSCGQVGNNLFFDPASNSLPEPAYLDLLTRGWAPIQAANFMIPGAGNYNPCVQATAPVISNWVVAEVTGDDATLNWTTDLPASSQILLTNTVTGVQVLTTSDNLLSTHHQVHLTGLDSGVLYKAQAVSVSADLGKAISDELSFRTF